ncbi:MAG: helix-turn-helix transcriptional regulator, partial [Actinobacteria bacterium]|nr:helix-turn-helix transcriptional regulator [Actinomycetota bacterium]
MARPGGLARWRERVSLICDAGGDARTLRLRLLAALRQAVGFDSYAWLLTDPETCVGSAPLADVPCLPELPRLIRLKYLTAVNRWTSLAAPPAGLLQQATGGDPSRSLVWRELLSRYDVGDVASVVFRDRFGCWGFLDLWRSGGGARFSRAEAAWLVGIAGPVTTALRRSQAGAFCGPATAGERRAGPVVLLLSPALEVLGQTPQTLGYLRVLVPPEEGRSPVPASAYNVAGQLMAAEAGVDGHPAMARVHLRDGLWVTVRAARIGNTGPVSERDITVSIEESSPPERIAVFARASGLTSRESQLLRHLASGTDTRELARRMFLSEHTVQDHLKSIFAKTATRSRRA